MFTFTNAVYLFAIVGFVSFAFGVSVFTWYQCEVLKEKKRRNKSKKYPKLSKITVDHILTIKNF